MISETLLDCSYPAKIIYNYKLLLELNPLLFKRLPMHEKYLLLEEMQRRAEILDNVSPQDRKDLKGEPIN